MTLESLERFDRQKTKQHFDRDGYVVLRGFGAGDELAVLQENVALFIRDVVPGMPPEHVFYEHKGDQTTLKQMQQMGDHDPFFSDLFTIGKFPDLVELLLEGPATPKNLQYFNKPAGVGQPTPPHQDGYYFMLEPCEAATMWLALDESDEENGLVR